MEKVVQYIKELIDIDSPSGYTDNIVDFLIKKLENKNYIIKKNNKGALLISTNENPELIIAGHIDTLGAMVSKINADGTLEIAQIGGWPITSFEGEYVRIFTQDNKIFNGTFLLKNPAAHVNKNVNNAKRELNSMHIRLDIESKSKKETEEKGIQVGDFVFFYPRFEYTNTGFIKSRFMDDKACAGIMIDVLLNNNEILKNKKIGFYFSNYEEVGHGASIGFPSAKELLVLDMGVVGNNVQGDETKVSICAKDSSGPYDYTMRMKLIEIAKNNNIPFVIDIFPYYGSDGSAALRAGADLKVALIGPGVSASHGLERVHIKGLNATRNLLINYIKNN